MAKNKITIDNISTKEYDLIITALSYYSEILSRKIEGEMSTEKPNKKYINNCKREQTNVFKLRSYLIISHEIWKR